MLFTCSLSYSQNSFEYVGKSNTFKSVSVRIDKTENGNQFIWTKDELNDSTFKDESIIMKRIIINCNDRTSKLERMIIYNTSGDVLLDEAYDEAPKEIVPDSLGESVLNFVCKKLNLKK